MIFAIHFQFLLPVFSVLKEPCLLFVRHFQFLRMDVSILQEHHLLSEIYFQLLQMVCLCLHQPLLLLSIHLQLPQQVALQFEASTMCCHVASLWMNHFSRCLPPQIPGHQFVFQDCNLTRMLDPLRYLPVTQMSEIMMMMKKKWMQQQHLQSPDLSA
ncbi:uncharacterized protein LOC126617464 isoform X3 [Malus sylvestris]|uniref:uncharacterized protein LOC126617464 isoform X3 n=1 Tax=Malus sylvestris TaxID=3752 RepID=UPI0021ACB314|nr:uncharacterized protein LOC126617464 isoform X3 [Malus sylvestris]